MAGLFKRMSSIFQAKADKALDQMEDPRETLDHSYKQQQELLQKVRRGVADVATSRKRVEMQGAQLQEQIDKLNGQARQALQVGREDLAREALTRKSGLETELADVRAQHNQLLAEEEKLISAQRRLQAKVEAFRTKKETLKATYSAAQAQAQVNDAFTGIGEEMGDVGMAIQRAEEKTQQLQARAAATDELMASGALDDMTGSTKDSLTRELEALSSTNDVESELAQMKAQLGGGQERPMLDQGRPAEPSDAELQQRQELPGQQHPQATGQPGQFPTYPASDTPGGDQQHDDQGGRQ